MRLQEPKRKPGTWRRNCVQDKIPSDVVHLDTGWFEEDWRCDYKFSDDRFKNPLKMIKDLAKQGFKISLWQLSYFNPKNRLFPEILRPGLAVTDGKGGLPTEEATLDFSNPKTVKWYQKNLAGLLQDGRRRHQGGFRRGRAPEGRLPLGQDGFCRAQPIPPALQQGRGGYFPGSHG